MKGKNVLSKILYYPLLGVFSVSAVYLLGSAYIASATPPSSGQSDCSFVPLFVALGIILAVFCGAILLNLLFGDLYFRTGKRVFALLSSVFDAVLAGVAFLIGSGLVSDRASAVIGAIFLIYGSGCAVCFAADVVRVFKKK